MLLAVVAYSNAMGGELLYDDRPQIAGNRFIQDGALLWEALLSDVWVFRSGAEHETTNYWRPFFVGWLAAGYRLFGLATTGWHVASLLAHLAVVLLVYRTLVALDLRAEVAALATWAFAAHPVHVQSVAWISGIPDVLMSGFLLASFLCWLRARRTSGAAAWAGALVLYILALLAKEVAVTFPAMVLLSCWILDRRAGASHRSGLRRGLTHAAPFLAAALAFVAARYQVLGVVRMVAPGAPGFDGVLLTLPSLLVFYLRQSLVPLVLSPFHPLRPVAFGSVDLATFWLPLGLLAVSGAAVWRLCRQDVACRHGLVWFVVPLLTALDTRVFTHEQQVQDRYLYLPVLGALVVAASFLVGALERLSGPRPRVRLATWAAGLAVAALLAWLSWRYNPVWANQMAFLEHSARVAPDSAIVHYLLGQEHLEAGRLPEARAALERAAEVGPDLVHVRVALGQLANQEGRHAEAERHLEPVVRQVPDYGAAVTQLGLAYARQGKTTEAIAVFEQGRRNLPAQHTRYTVYIAQLHRLAGRTELALAELESVRPQLDESRDPDELIGWFRLGELYRERGDSARAAGAYRRYLEATAGIDDPELHELHDYIRQALANLR